MSSFFLEICQDEYASSPLQVEVKELVVHLCFVYVKISRKAGTRAHNEMV